jgi:hypothetical protein
VPVQRGVRTVLHDPQFDLQLHAENQFAETAALPEEANPGTDELQMRLVFTPKESGKLLRDLPVVHEHPMHVTIVSADLSSFDHIHPVPQPDGSLQIDHRFPHAGRYLVYAEYFPSSQRDQVFRFPLTVGEKSAGDDELMHTELVHLEPSPASVKPIANHPEMTAELITQPRTMVAGTHAMLLFRLTDHGQPVTDLQPYMGAMGHCAIISQDTQSFLHCHPEQLFPTTPDSRGGPDIAFHTAFPKPGRYKVWAQFKRNGKVIVADFVVDVKKPILPPNVIRFLLDD